MADRITANDLPDIGLASQADSVTVLNEARSGAGILTLTLADIPRPAGRSIRLISRDEAQAQADATGTEVFFVAAWEPQITGSAGSLVLGTSLAAPQASTKNYLCCCTRPAAFTKTDGRWRFTRWGIGKCV
ncbi:MAG: hypothetical protein U0610_17945 [bacterium]